MWAIVARELGVPWRAAESMHWHLGEQEIARRAGVTPFTMAAASGRSPSSNMALPGVTSPMRAPVNNPGGLGSGARGRGSLGGPVGAELPPILEGHARSGEDERRDESGRRRRAAEGRGRGATVLPSFAELEGGVGAYDDDDDDDDEAEEEEEEGRRVRR
jgi:hypothetical protein